MKSHKSSKAVEKVVILMTVLTIIVGNISIIKCSCELIKATGDLKELNYKIQFYDELDSKTDTMIAKEEECLQIREQEYYNSDNPLIRFYSNHNMLVRIICIIIALLAILAIILMDGYYLYQIGKLVIYRVAPIRETKESQKSQKPTNKQ